MSYEVDREVSEDSIRIRYEDEESRTPNEMAGDVEKLEGFRPAEDSDAKYDFTGEIGSYPADITIHENYIELELDLESGSGDLKEVMDAAEEAREMLKEPDEYSIDVPDKFKSAEIPGDGIDKYDDSFIGHRKSI